MTDVSLVRLVREGSVAVIEIDHPPVNALSHPVRQALWAAIEAADGDPAVRAIVIHAAGRHFIAGADVREFDGEGPHAPLLNTTLLRLEACSKPVVAALHGTTFGGGAELALASHYRVATADLSFGFPEIHLGLMPGSGGTVRLPRWIPMAKALDMMLSGQPLKFAEAESLGLIDQPVGEDVRAGAVAYARSLVAAGAAVRRSRDRDPPSSADTAVFSAARSKMPAAARKVPAGENIVLALEACAAQPFDTALAETRRLFEACRVSPASRALRHLFFAERGGTTSAKPRDVQRVGVVGAGTMGSGIAISLASAGYRVVVADNQEASVNAGLARVGKHFDDAVAKGRMTAAAASKAAGLVGGATELVALADADLIIEAVFENLEVKQQVFARLGEVCKPGAVLATNTSTLDVDLIAAASGRPADVVGMHYFSPAHVMKLLEIVRSGQTTAEALATALAVGKRTGKVGVVVGNGFGFVGNRMLYAYGREREIMLLEGATPQQVDQAMTGFGMAMGPCAVGDLSGLDVGYAVRKGWAAKPDDPRYYRVSDLLVEAGRLGQKTGAGFYLYPEGSRGGTPDPAVDAIIAAEAARLGITQRPFEDAEIVERSLLSLANEGARILDEGLAASAADIDVIWCNGYGFPRHRGGPMHYAGSLGATHVLSRVRHWAERCGDRYWRPAEGLVTALAG
jgi:3-hydroxyacyl-CoA dehydrogenase